MKRLFYFLLLSNACLGQSEFIMNPGFEPIPKELNKEYSLEQQVLRRFGSGCNTCLHDWTALLVSADFNNAFIEFPPKAQAEKWFGESFGMITFYSHDLKGDKMTSGYLGTKLKKKMLAGRRYEVSFQIALSRNLSNYSTNKMGIHFSEHEIKLDTVLPLLPQLEMAEIVDTTGEYVLFKDTITADANYRFMLIGYFPKGIALKKQYRLADFDGVDIDRAVYDERIHARYSFDEVSIREITDAVALEKEIRSKVTLRNIQFETGSSVLLEIAKPELLKLAKWLSENEEVHLVIEGHTDDIGEMEANQHLSENRAIAVVDFLKGQGLQQNRLKALGFGESMPLQPNDSAENRTINRRVEIKVVME